MRRLGVSVIGVGAISESAHLPNLLKIPSVRVVNICDINLERLDYIGKLFNIEKRFTNYIDAIQDEHVDAVIIATSAPEHARITLACIDKQIPVFVEKPLATSISDARAIVQASEKHNCPVMVGFQLRFLPNHQIVKKYLYQNEIGPLLMAHIRAETLVIKPAESLLIDYGTHFFDLIRYYFPQDPIIAISSHVKYIENDQVGASILLEYESGIHTNIELYWLPQFNWGIVDRTLEVLGLEGKITTKMSGPEVYLWRTKSTRDRMFGVKTLLPKEAKTAYTPLSDYCYQKELESFFSSIIKKEAFEVSAIDGLKSLEIAHYALISFQEKRKITGLQI